MSELCALLHDATASRPDLDPPGFCRRPVDFVAEAIAGISSAQRRGIGLYHVVNPHWNDNVSLDSFLGWVEACGYPLKRIPDYTQW